MDKIPYTFDEFFASGFAENISPFLTKSSRKWGKNLFVKSSILAAIFLAMSYIVMFFQANIGFFFLSFVYFLAGIPAVIGALKDLKNLEVNIDVLMTLAAIVALFIGNELEGGLLLVLFSLSSSMEQSVTNKARGALHRLNELAPKMAWVIDEEQMVFQKSVKEISKKTHLLVKAGEIVPLDGIIIKGNSSFNFVHLTGESLPSAKRCGEELPAGARNLESAVVIEVTKTSSDSTLSLIIDLITQAQKAKPKLQRWLDRFGKIYASSVIFLTFFFALSLPFFFSIHFWGNEGSIYRALAFMIAASPCALIIATPTAYLSSISACARNGILLKGGITLDAIASCKKIAFDKTGTLTTGKLKCLEVISLINTKYSIEFALAAAAGLEKHIIHPIAGAIVDYAQEKKVQIPVVENFKQYPGFGLQGTLQHEEKILKIYVGLSDFVLSKLTKNQKELEEKLTQIRRDGEIITLLSIDNSIFLFRFLDSVRPDMKKLIDLLKNERRLDPIMVTGDHSSVADIIGKQVGIDQIFSNLRPEDKLQIVAKLSGDAGLAMVGDGINDAPALARATIGISLGKIGSATAVDASDVVLLNDDVLQLHWLFKKAHQTLKIIKQNLTLALGVILLATTPALLGVIPLWIAVVLHEGGTVIVGLNSLRLLKK